MIRSSKHSLKFTNKEKLIDLHKFIDDYHQVLNKFINMQWNEQDYKSSFLAKDKYSKVKTNFNARMRQCASKQACSIVKSILNKHHKRLYKLKKLQKEGKDTKFLQRKISLTKLTKPIIKDKVVELDPRFVNVKITNNHFNLFVQIKIGNKRINVPIKHTKVSKKWLHGKLLNSIRLTKNNITLYFNLENKISNGNKTLGIDQGILNVVSCSDGQVTKKDIHGHDLNSIINKLSRKQKGSKSFKRAQEHRKNYVNWSIKSINLDNVKEIKLEKLFNIRKCKNVSRKLSHWTFTSIEKKIREYAEEFGVQVILQNCTYRSQRCSQCGYTHKSNRKGKTFKCLNCYFVGDSDLNAASNHEIELFKLPATVWQNRINRIGFFWGTEGYNFGQEFIVPDVKEDNFK